MSDSRFAPLRSATPVRLGAASSRDDVELAAYTRALGHPARIAILRILLEHGECVCGRIVERLPLAQATVSQHLKVLTDAGLVRGESDPPRVRYGVDRVRIERLRRLIATL